MPPTEPTNQRPRAHRFVFELTGPLADVLVALVSALLDAGLGNGRGTLRVAREWLADPTGAPSDGEPTADDSGPPAGDGSSRP